MDVEMLRVEFVLLALISDGESMVFAADVGFSGRPGDDGAVVAHADGTALTQRSYLCVIYRGVAVIHDVKGNMRELCHVGQLQFSLMRLMRFSFTLGKLVLVVRDKSLEAFSPDFMGFLGGVDVGNEFF